MEPCNSHFKFLMVTPQGSFVVVVTLKSFQRESVRKLYLIQLIELNVKHFHQGHLAKSYL